MNERLTFGSGYARARTAGHAPAAPVAVATPVAPVVTAKAARRTTTRDGMELPFAGLMAFTLLLYLRPQDIFPPLAVLPMADIAAIGGLGSMVYRRMSRGLSVTRLPIELTGVFAFAAIMLLTAPFSIWPGGAIQTFTGMFAKVMLIFILMVNTLTTPERVRRFTWVLVLATSYIAFRAVFDYARGMNLVENGRVMGSVGGMFRNPNDLALNMVAILPIAVMLFMLRTSSMVGRLVAGFGAFLMVGATIASQSRAGFMGLGAMLLFLTIQIGRKKPMVMAAALLAVFLALPMVPNSYWARMSSITDASADDTGSRAARKILLAEAFETFLSHPMTGVGAGLFQAYNPKGRTEAWRETHNVLLQVAAELGIAGLLVFMFLIYRAGLAGRQTRALLRRTLAPAKKRPWSQAPAPADTPPTVISRDESEFIEVHGGAITAALAGWFFCALFASVAYQWTFYYLMALAIMPREIVLDRLRGSKA
jgi:putative inorganic carbon (hco3(-)) transporter